MVYHTTIYIFYWYANLWEVRKRRLIKNVERKTGRQVNHEPDSRSLFVETLRQIKVKGEAEAPIFSWRSTAATKHWPVSVDQLLKCLLYVFTRSTFQSVFVLSNFGASEKRYSVLQNECCVHFARQPPAPAIRHVDIRSFSIKNCVQKRLGWNIGRLLLNLET